MGLKVGKAHAFWLNQINAHLQLYLSAHTLIASHKGYMSCGILEGERHMANIGWFRENMVGKRGKTTWQPLVGFGKT